MPGSLTQISLLLVLVFLMTTALLAQLILRYRKVHREVQDLALSAVEQNEALEKARQDAQASEARLTDAIENDPQAVTDFFLDDDAGFANGAEETLKTFTDPFTGSFVTENEALQSTIDLLSERIIQLDEILASRRERLLSQFHAMENALSALTTQQSAIIGISPLNIQPVGTGLL